MTYAGRQKLCITCKNKLPINKFYRHPGMKDKRLNKCMECVKKYQFDRRRKNPKVQEYDRLRYYTNEIRRKRLAKNARIWRESNPEKYRAHSAVNNAIRSGKIKRKSCEKCGNEKTHAHHPNYKQPLSVIWLCAMCHQRLHHENRIY